MGVAIVALPAEDERVWKISSEKKPHMTLLFLGDAANISPSDLEQMMLFVQHATEICEHGPFYLDVESRGTLGPDEADVLFFNKRSWNLKWIREFRGQLLKNDQIKTAYDSVDQYDEWLPHLTLGYPETPAKPIPADWPDRPFYGIQFDRIAVWEGDYEGPEFKLESPDREGYDDLAVAYSDIQTPDDHRRAMGMAAVTDLMHYGVKGMQWGKRKSPNVVERPKNEFNPKEQALIIGTGGLATLHPKLFRKRMTNERNLRNFQKDKKWEKDFKKAKSFGYDDQKFTKAYNDKWKDHDFSNEDWSKPSPTYQKYIDGYMKEMSVDYSKQFAAHYGESPSGKYEAHLDKATNIVSLRKKAEVQHADEILVSFRLILDGNGLITGLEQMEDSMEQAAELGAQFLEHHGVKGQKWGVRRDRKGRDRLNPEGYSVKGDVARLLLFPQGATAPAIIRLGKRANQGTKAYLEKRNTPEAKAKRAKRREARRDFYWEMHAYSDISHADVHNKVADEIDSKVFQLQTAPKYRGKNLKTDKKLNDEYEQDVAKVTDAAYRRAVNDTYGTNPSGTKKAVYVNDVRGARIEVRDLTTGKSLSEKMLNPIEQDVTQEDTLGHADSPPFSGPDILMTVKTNAEGFITEIGRVKLPEDQDLAQSAIHGEAFVDGLMHYGVKGMHWGIRRSMPEAVAPVAQSKVPHGTKRKTKIEVDGGENHPASEDAIKVAKARVKLHKSGPAALTNQELRDVATRMQLESQVVSMNRSPASKFIRNLISQQGKQAANQVVKSNVDKQIKR